MQTTPAVEDYLKTIWQLHTTGSPPTPSAVADRLGVSAPSVSAMTKRLLDAGLVARPSGRELTLTRAGEAAALRVVRRHRLLETFLVNVVGLAWDEVHAEAEVLEHVLSPRLEQRIDELLGHPSRDPHGDPIPPADGSPYDEDWADPLGAAAQGTRFTVQRVSDRDSGALRHLADLGIGPGVELAVGEQAPYGGPLWVTVLDRSGAGAAHALGSELLPIIYGRTS